MDDFVVNTEDKITSDELKQLKDIARYWSAGKVMVSVIVGLGAFGVAVVQIWDFVGKR